MKRDSAVSPVIGSILLVAITVIIAAVIAAFVFGMTGDIQQTRVVAITSDISQNPTVTGEKQIDITNHGGKDTGALSAIEIFVDGYPCTGTLVSGTLASLVEVGNSVRLRSATCAGSSISPASRNHLVIVGTFLDGTNQVLLDTYQ